MGCISSKLTRVVDTHDKATTTSHPPRHVVSLTSTTYGHLKLETSKEPDDDKKSPSAHSVPLRKSTSKEEPLEVIDAWELMVDLQDDDLGKDRANSTIKIATTTPAKKIETPDPPKPKIAPSSTPRKPRKLFGKENSPKNGVKPSPSDWNRGSNTCPVRRTPLSIRYKSTPSTDLRAKDRLACSSRRRSLTPMFDPELVASFEKELEREREQIKMVISSTPRRRRSIGSSSALLESYERLCPRDGEDSVVMYTTTLRGIRKTFEDCNAARSAVEACGVRFIERDISMDSGYREELRVLMGSRYVMVPVVFVKGRLIGGVAEILRLEEEGKLESLLAGIPRATATACDGCGGVRFVLCAECNGSCKVRKEEEEGKVAKCGECNENGLIHCPICC